MRVSASLITPTDGGFFYNLASLSPDFPLTDFIQLESDGDLIGILKSQLEKKPSALKNHHLETCTFTRWQSYLLLVASNFNKLAWVAATVKLSIKNITLLESKWPWEDVWMCRTEGCMWSNRQRRGGGPRHCFPEHTNTWKWPCLPIVSVVHVCRLTAMQFSVRGGVTKRFWFLISGAKNSVVEAQISHLKYLLPADDSSAITHQSKHFLPTTPPEYLLREYNNKQQRQDTMIMS